MRFGPGKSCLIRQETPGLKAATFDQNADKLMISLNDC
jgi:hypothetical protein